jgi:two-component system, NarL family, nitrate/nitrite response regulator NarL
MFFSDEISAEMMKAVSERSQKKEEKIHLTDREKEIIKLIAQEYSNAQIGEKLFISERTVETHRKNIFRKANTKTIVGLMKFAIENKLID